MHNEDIVAENRSGLDLSRLFEVLDGRSRTILWYLWSHRHAHISELRNLFATASDFEVLYRLKEVINKKALEIWSRPVVSFEESKTDPLVGEKVLFSWWLLDDEDVHLNSSDKPIVDIFDEKDAVTIIAQLPARENAASRKADLKKQIPEFKVLDVKYNNGILQINLGKERN